MLPLNGITVVSVEQAVAAPFATRQLADLGARVIKIERPDGGDFARGYDTTVNGLSSYFVWLNRSKESLTLDLKRPAVRRRAGAAARARRRVRAEPRARRRRSPRHGAVDAARRASAADRLQRVGLRIVRSVRAEEGLRPARAERGRAACRSPAATMRRRRVGISVADIAAGMYAYSGILTALLARDRDRPGHVARRLAVRRARRVDGPARRTTRRTAGRAPPRTGANHASIAPYGPFRAGDGGSIMLGIQNAREWTRFCARRAGSRRAGRRRALQHQHACACEHRPALHAVIESVFATLTAGEVVERLESAGIACARLNSVGEFLDHPQLAERDVWREIGSPAGPLRAHDPAGPDGRRRAGDGRRAGARPAYRRDSRRAGVARDTIAAWRKEGAI